VQLPSAVVGVPQLGLAGRSAHVIQTMSPRSRSSPDAINPILLKTCRCPHIDTRFPKIGDPRADHCRCRFWRALVCPRRRAVRCWHSHVLDVHRDPDRFVITS